MGCGITKPAAAGALPGEKPGVQVSVMPETPSQKVASNVPRGVTPDASLNDPTTPRHEMDATSQLSPTVSKNLELDVSLARSDSPRGVVSPTSQLSQASNLHADPTQPLSPRDRAGTPVHVSDTISPGSAPVSPRNPSATELHDSAGDPVTRPLSPTSPRAPDSQILRPSTPQMQIGIHDHATVPRSATPVIRSSTPGLVSGDSRPSSPALDSPRRPLSPNSSVSVSQSADEAMRLHLAAEEEERQRALQDQQRAIEEAQRAAREEQDRVAAQSLVSSEQQRQQKLEDQQRWAAEQQRREQEEAEEIRRKEIFKQKQEQLIAKQQADMQFMEMRERQERKLMEEEDSRSAEREIADTEQQRLYAYEQALKRKEQEELRMKALEDEARKKDVEDLNNPSLISFKVVFPNEQMFEVYRYHLQRETATIMDLKLQINMDFGYSFTQQRFFYKNKECDDDQVIDKLQDWKDDSWLRFYPTGEPPVVPERILRPLITVCGGDAVSVGLTVTQDPLPADIKYFDEHQPASASRPAFRDWTRELLAVESKSRETPLEALDAEKAMYELFEDFYEAAERSVELILRRELAPTFNYDFFGAGGDKYYQGGILLRKVANWEIMGDNVGEGDAAFKAAGHELKTLEKLRGQVQGLTVPLATIVDHFGHRFLAMSAVDISFNTLVYGSNNDGLAIKANPDAAPIAEKIASTMNLAPHSVLERLSEQQVMLYTPYTTELHLCANPGYMTVINTGRLFPPDAPGPDRIDLTVKMLRPELVQRYGFGEQLLEGYKFYTSTMPRVCDECHNIVLEYEFYTYEKRQYDVCVTCYNTKQQDSFRYPKNRLDKKIVPESQRLDYYKNDKDDIQFTKPIQLTPLNPDAYCSKTDKTSVTELKQASAYLQDTVIPRFIHELDVLESVPLNGRQLTEEMHKRGINMRYLGVLALKVKLNHIRELTVREMLARAIKVLIRDGLSFLENYNDNDAKDVVQHYLNEIFTPHETTSSLTVWKYIEELCHKKFAYVIEETVREKLYCLALVHAVVDKIGVTLTRYKGYDFADQHPFGDSDSSPIDTLAPHNKHHKFVCHEADVLEARARDLDHKGKRKFWYTPGGPERAQASELLKEAVSVCEFVFGRDHPRTADAAFALAQQLESRHAERGRPEQSRWNRSAGVPADALSQEAETNYRTALKVREDTFGFYHADVAACYLGIARVQKDQTAESMIELMSKSVDITETLLGFNHPETAEVYRLLALVYQELNRPRDASPWIRKSFVIFMAIFGKDAEITKQTWRQLQSIELSIDSGLEDAPIEELTSRIEALHFA